MKYNCTNMLCASALLLISLAGCGGGGGGGNSNSGSPSLTWVASTSYAPGGNTWSQADSFCNTLIFNTQTGWRLPTQAELTAFAKSHQIGSSNQYNPSGSVVNVWSSSPGQTQFTHLYVDINDSTGTAYQAADLTGYSVYCVR
jgi:hypothetical protein